MEKQFITYEIAIKLKELGFNEPCIGFFTEEYKKLIVGIRFKIHTENDLPTRPLSAPLWQQVIDWLMDEHLIFVGVKCEKWLHTFCGLIEDEEGFIETEDVNDYHTALNDAIKEALNIVSKK